MVETIGECAFKNEQYNAHLYREHGDMFRDGTRATVDMLIRMAEAARPPLIGKRL